MKKKNKRQRKKRKKEMSNNTGQPSSVGSLEKLPSPQEMMQTLTRQLAQLEQQEDQIRANFAIQWVNVANNIAGERIKQSQDMSKTALAKIVSEAVDAAEVMRQATQDYAEQLKKQADLPEQLEEAKKVVLNEINNLNKRAVAENNVAGTQ
jgi:hypothetical protein